MLVTKEYNSADEFKFWSGAQDTYNRLAELDLLEELWDCIEQNFDGETPTETQVNDFVWFEDEVIKDFIGFDFWKYDSKDEADEAEQDEEDEDEEDEVDSEDKAMTKEFATGFKDYTISRIDYESMPCPMDTKDFDDEKMQELANRIGEELNQRNFDEESPYYDDVLADAFWSEMERCAVEMNMPYYEDED